MPDLGFLVGDRFGLEQMGPLGELTRAASTLGEALDIFCRQLGRWIGGAKAWLEPDGDLIWLVNSSDDGLRLDRRVANQNSLLLSINLVRLAAEPSWTPPAIKVADSDRMAAEGLETLGDSRQVFHPEEVGIALHTEMLAKPIARSAQSPDCTRLDLAGTPGTFQAALTRTLRDQIPHLGMVTLEMAAEICGTSQRSLQRRLHADGISFRQLGDRARFEAARDLLLADPEITIAEVAAAVGYTSPNNFARAFRKITGTTPLRFARRASGNR